MSTLAVACATAENLSIVGDSRSTPLHHRLLAHDTAGLYVELVLDNRPNFSDRAPEVKAHEVLQYLLEFRCDVSQLSPQDLLNLKDDRGAIDDLFAALETSAARIGRHDHGKLRDQRIEHEINTILTKWKESRANLSGFWARFFGEGADEGEKFIGKIAENAVTGAVSGTLAVPSFTTAAAGAGAGLAISLVRQASQTRSAIKADQANHPLRFLSAMESRGVALLSDFTRMDSLIDA